MYSAAFYCTGMHLAAPTLSSLNMDVHPEFSISTSTLAWFRMSSVSTMCFSFGSVPAAKNVMLLAASSPSRSCFVGGGGFCAVSVRRLFTEER